MAVDTAVAKLLITSVEQAAGVCAYEHYEILYYESCEESAAVTGAGRSSVAKASRVLCRASH